MVKRRKMRRVIVTSKRVEWEQSCFCNPLFLSCWLTAVGAALWVGFCLDYRRIFSKVESLCIFLGNFSDELILFMLLVVKSGHRLTNAKALSIEQETAMGS